MSIVVDASVALKWYFPEEYSAEAFKLLSRYTEAHIPDLLLIEFGNVLWQRVKRGSISADEASRVAISLDSLPITLHRHSAHTLLPAALEIACQTGATVHDSLYIALAKQKETFCITADQKLINIIENTPLAKHIAWVGTVA